jgi:hypothetical protein
VNPEAGWLARQLTAVAQEVAAWPAWMRREAGIGRPLPENAVSKYFVWFSLDKLEPFELTELASEAEVVAFLNRHAGNAEFRFRVVHGNEVAFKAVTVATRYERAS